MINVHPEYIVDENLNRKSVVLPYSEWENIVEEMEELDDIRAYDKDYSYSSQGWYDRAWKETTTEVPEPPALALMGLGLLGLIGVRRRSIKDSSKI